MAEPKHREVCILLVEKLRGGMQIALDAVRVHAGYGYSVEFDVERYFRDALLMIVGEGTNEIRRNVIARQLVIGRVAIVDEIGIVYRAGPPAARPHPTDPV